MRHLDGRFHLVISLLISTRAKSTEILDRTSSHSQGRLSLNQRFFDYCAGTVVNSDFVFHLTPNWAQSTEPTPFRTMSAKKCQGTPGALQSKTFGY